MTTMCYYSVVLVPADSNGDLQELSTSNEDEQVEATFDSSSVKLTLLVRPLADGTPGLYAYSSTSSSPNVRATRLAMACGLFSLRFFGDVLLVRHRQTSLSVSGIHGAACVSPDLRESIQREVSLDEQDAHRSFPVWLERAVQENYHDKSVLLKFAQVMSVANDEDDNDDACSQDDHSIDDHDAVHTTTNRHITDNEATSFLAKTPLCLQCRGPSTVLCSGCKAVYFCAPPRTCRETCWSHECMCATYRVYASRREELLRFDHLGDWKDALSTRECEVSAEPWQRFLEQHSLLKQQHSSSWWSTETDGWAGGQSGSAKLVNPTVRKTFAQGFAPVTEIPNDERPSSGNLSRNDLGLLQLSSWADYYRLRNLPPSTPVALLLTFPLTLYHVIEKFGKVPITVARMLNRPLRIHIIGVEKELNFIDLFKEVTYLLPVDLKLELVFCVRRDMLPPESPSSLRLEIADALVVYIVAGTYGGDDLDPNFDAGSGTPDMIVAFNAGLFAYESWRLVVEYLASDSNVVGVFTDYNEHSGVNCAGLGNARKTLEVNPFRQPRAMPVYSMNLPQLSNGFIYVFNELELD